MKSLKLVGYIAGALAVLAILAVSLAFTSGVQTWAVRRAVANQPGLTIEVSKVNLGFSAAEISGLKVLQDGLTLSVASLTTRHSAWAYLAGKRVDVEELTIKDALVELRQPAPSTPAASAASGAKEVASRPAKPATTTAEAAKPAFEGLLKQARLPVDLRVAKLAINGRARLPEKQEVVFELKGSGIETGQKGRVEWTVDFSDPKTGAPVRGARSTGSLALHLAADRRIDLVELETTGAAMGPDIPSDQIKLAAKAAQTAGGADEDYSLALSLVRGGKAEQVVSLVARFAAAAKEISGSWEIALRSEQLAALLSGFGLPEIAATGSGKFSLKPETQAASANGTLRAAASQLQKVSPALAAIGAVEIKSSFDGSVGDSAAQLNAFSVEVADGKGRTFAQLGLLQKVTYRLSDRRITLADLKAEAARLTLRAIPLAWAQPSAKPLEIESGDLSLVLAVEGETDGSRVRARAVEPLSLRDVTVRDAQKKALVEHVTLSLRPSVDYTATTLRAQLSDLQLAMATGDSISGTVNADVSNLGTKPATAFTARLQANLATLHKPFLAFDPGALAATVEAEGRHEGNTLQLAKAAATVQGPDRALLAAVELLQALRVELKAGTITPASPTTPAARVRLGEIPLAWAQPYVAQSKLGGSLAGLNLEVSLRSLEDLTATTVDPLQVRNISASIAGQPLLQAVDLSAAFSATKRKDVVAYELRRLEVKQGTSTLLSTSATGEARLGGTTQVSAKGSLEADVAGLMAQPALTPYATLNRGKLTTAFEAAIGDTTQAKATLAAKDLVAKQDNRPLGEIEASITASLKADGSGSGKASLVVTNSGRKSDALFEGTVGKASDKTTVLFTGKLASANLIVDDLQALAALAPASQPAKPAPTSPSSTTVVRAPRPATAPAGGPNAVAGAKRDTQPFWKGANGKVEVDLKRIIYGKDYTISNVRGTAVITDQKLSLDGLEGRFKDNPFKLAGGVTYAAQLPQPYALAASADVQNFDVGEFLRATNPNEKPALETKATLSARLNGNGGTAADLAKNAFGKFEVTGTKGVMNLLARKGQASAVANLASIGLAVLGASRGSDTTVAIAELTRMLDRVEFDNLKLQIERGADLAFKLSSVEVMSPVLRLTGTGGVASKSTEDLQNAPMNIVLQLGAKGELAQVLNRVGQLVNKQDEKGYYLMSRTFNIGGTPGKPDNSALWKLLLEAGIGAFAR
ncbi:MAG: hypothetical protein HZC55_09700 [Verrucomicrobia bacterium]|nr:hypothetical protein [Verrucomicrobiota bacterium]